MRAPRDAASRACGLLLVFIVLGGVLATGGSLAGSAGEPGNERAGRPLTPTSGVWFEEVVTHPLSDWQGNDRVSSTDEYIVLRNFGSGDVDTSGWVLHMIDGTDEEFELGSVLGPGEALVVLNPPGRINNDVRLLLLDAQGEAVDEVHLGSGGVPEGRGEDRLDEAVHLVGPWAGLRAPGTLGKGLGPMWVSHVAAAGVLSSADVFEAAWFPPESSALELQVHAAPGVQAGLDELQVGGSSFGLSAVTGQEGVWVSQELPAWSGESFTFIVTGSGGSMGSFPDGSPLKVRMDPVAPHMVPLQWGGDGNGDGNGDVDVDAGEGIVVDHAVADGEGRIRWFPELFVPLGGLISVDVVESLQSMQELEDCVPLVDPGPGCVLPSGADTVGLVVLDRAGRLVEKTLPVVVWEDPPRVPNATFAQGPPPTLVWETPDRPLAQLRVESAHDETGAWPVREVTLAGNATRFVDDEWSAGEPRAYRLWATDLAGNTATGAWRVLDPQDVPVQIELTPFDVGQRLGESGQAEVVLATDRQLEVPPRLALRLQEPRPVYEEVEAEPVVMGGLNGSASAFSYVVRLPQPMGEAKGTLSVVGGKSVDGAPLMPLVMNVSWDHKPPRVEFSGLSENWIRDERHVITVNAVDGIDPSPGVSFQGLPGNATVGGPASSPRVTLHGQGVFEVHGEVVDASGNKAPFVVKVGLDAKAPHVKEVERPLQWSAGSALRIQVQDEVSGVNESSLRVWVRNASMVLDAHVANWTGDVAHVVPVNVTGPVLGPYEVYLGVMDRAGNAVEGFLSGRLVPVHGEADANGSSDPVRAGLSDDPTGPGRAPSFLGPPWQSAPGQDTQSSTEEGSHDASPSVTKSPLDGFSWDDVSPGEEGRSAGWYLVALASLVGLGTMVHQVRRRKRPRDAGKASEQTGERTGRSAESTSGGGDKQTAPDGSDAKRVDLGTDAALGTTGGSGSQDAQVDWGPQHYMHAQREASPDDGPVRQETLLPLWDLECGSEPASGADGAPPSAASFVVVHPGGVFDEVPV